jgi:hypothetical protein
MPAGELQPAIVTNVANGVKTNLEAEAAFKGPDSDILNNNLEIL